MEACSENAFDTKQVMEASHTIVEIKIKTLDSHVYTCRVEKNVSVPDLKEQVALVTGVPSGSQRLICRGKVLKDEHVLSAYEVEDGHTLHLVTRSAPPPSVSVAPIESQSEEQDSHDYSSLNRPGHISHSVLVGTFNFPDRANVVFPEINRVFSSVLSSLRVGSFFPPATGTSNGNTAVVPPSTASLFSSGQERESSADQRLENRTVDLPSAAIHQSGSREVSRSIDGFPSLHGETGYIGAIPAVSHVQIVHQIVPNALSSVLQHVNRLEHTFAANGQAQTSVSHPDGQFEQNEHSSSASGELAAWASAMRRVQELLSNQAGTELQRLADQLEVESSLESVTARENILTAGMRLEQLGRLLLDLGGITVALGRDTSEAGRGSGSDRRTEIAAIHSQSAEPRHVIDNDDTMPANMNIHIHAGLPPFLVARNFLSQAAPDGPSLSLNIDTNRDPVDFQHDHASNGSANIFMQSLGSMLPPANLEERGLPRASLPELLQDSPASDAGNTGRGVFYPLLARFQHLNPALLSRQDDLSLGVSSSVEGFSHPIDSMSSHQQYPSLSVLQAVVENQEDEIVGGVSEAGFAVEERSICPTQPEIGITGYGPRLSEGSFKKSNATEADEDHERPLLHGMGSPSSASGRQEQEKPEQVREVHGNNDMEEQGEAGMCLQLDCSGGQVHVEKDRSNHTSGSLLLLNNLTGSFVSKQTTASSELEASRGFLSDGVHPFLSSTGLCDQLYEQAGARESQDCGMTEEASTATGGGQGTVLQDFLSTLACRHDEKRDAELLSADPTPRELSLVLETVEDRGGLCLDSSGFDPPVDVTPHQSLRCSAEGSKRHGLETSGAFSETHIFQEDGEEKLAMGRNEGLCSLKMLTNKEASCRGPWHLSADRHRSSRQSLDDSEGFHAHHQSENGGLFSSSMDNKLSASASLSGNTQEDSSKRCVRADSNHEGVPPPVKRQKML